jgi:hypothetical protein
VSVKKTRHASVAVKKIPSRIGAMMCILRHAAACTNAIETNLHKIGFNFSRVALFCWPICEIKPEKASK